VSSNDYYKKKYLNQYLNRIIPPLIHQKNMLTQKGRDYTKIPTS